MKRFLGFVFVVFGLLLFAGCEVVSTETGDYKEGTYFGVDADSGYTAVVYVDDEGFVKSVFIDAPYIKYDSDGNCPTVEKYGQVQCVPTTKQSLGDEYGMVVYSEATMEWYEQAEDFSDKVVEEQGLDWVEWSEDDETKLSADVISTVTISVDGIYKAVDAALKQAK